MHFRKKLLVQTAYFKFLRLNRKYQLVGKMFYFLSKGKIVNSNSINDEEEL